MFINHLYLDIVKEILAAAFHEYDIRKPFQERFFLIWRNIFNYLLANPVQLSFIEQCSISPIISAEVREASNRSLAPLNGFIEEGIESGYLKNMDIQLTLSLVYGAIVSTAQLQLSGTLEITDEHREAAAQYCWNGLKAE